MYKNDNDILRKTTIDLKQQGLVQTTLTKETAIDNKRH